MTAPTDPDRPDEPTVQVSWASSAPPADPSDRPPRRRAPVVLAVVVALVLILVAAVAVRALLSDGPPSTNTPTTPAPSPTDGRSSTPASTPPAPRTPAPERSTAPEPTFRAARVTFTHFTVEVRDARLTKAHGLLVGVRVCVRRLPPDPQGNRTRISWDPWSVTTTSGARQRPRLFDASHPPADLFPADRTYRVGQCARGWIPFAGVSRLEQVKAVDYRNGVGDRTTWKRS